VRKRFRLPRSFSLTSACLTTPPRRPAHTLLRSHLPAPSASSRHLHIVASCATFNIAHTQPAPINRHGRNSQRLPEWRALLPRRNSAGPAPRCASLKQPKPQRHLLRGPEQQRCSGQLAVPVPHRPRRPHLLHLAATKHSRECLQQRRHGGEPLH
jgi:hypothetical protein